MHPNKFNTTSEPYHLLLPSTIITIFIEKFQIVIIIRLIASLTFQTILLLYRNWVDLSIFGRRVKNIKFVLIFFLIIFESKNHIDTYLCAFYTFYVIYECVAAAQNYICITIGIVFDVTLFQF